MRVVGRTFQVPSQLWGGRLHGDELADHVQMTIRDPRVLSSLAQPLPARPPGLGAQ